MDEFTNKFTNETKRDYLQRMMNEDDKIYIPLTDSLMAEVSPCDKGCIVKLADDIYGIIDSDKN